MASISQKLSFTVRRPSPPQSRGISPGMSDSGPNFKIPALPKHLSAASNHSNPSSRSATSSPNPAQRRGYDSSDEDEESQDELVTGFNKFGVERADGRSRRVPDAPLVIPALQNKDWRAIARKRRGGGCFIPESGKAGTGADGSVGGLGTKDSINSGPVLSGLQVRKRDRNVKTEASDGDIVMEEDEEVKIEDVGETEDQTALRALLAEANGTVQDNFIIQTIPTPVSEADALKQDIEGLPDVATLDDYERVPVSQFGAAMLRGMGWKEGTAASRKPGKGMVEPYLPPPRPALLGIGAKEQEVLDDGGKKKHKKPAAKYLPVVKTERGDSNRDRERSRSPTRSSTVSRRPSRSPDRRDKEKRHDDSYRKRDRDSGRSGNQDYEQGRDRVRERDRSGREGDGDRDYRRDYDREHKDRRRNLDSSASHRRSESSRGSSKRRD